MIGSISQDIKGYASTNQDFDDKDKARDDDGNGDEEEYYKDSLDAKIKRMHGQGGDKQKGFIKKIKHPDTDFRGRPRFGYGASMSGNQSPIGGNRMESNCECNGVDNNSKNSVFNYDNDVFNDDDEHDYQQMTDQMIQRVKSGELLIDVQNDIARDYARQNGGSYDAFDFAYDALGRRAWEMGLATDDPDSQDHPDGEQVARPRFSDIMRMRQLAGLGENDLSADRIEDTEDEIEYLQKSGDSANDFMQKMKSSR